MRALAVADESFELTMMINVINSFNRLAVGYRLGPMAAAKPERSAA